MQSENGLARTLIDACEFSLTMQGVIKELALAPGFTGESALSILAMRQERSLASWWVPSKYPKLASIKLDTAQLSAFTLCFTSWS